MEEQKKTAQHRNPIDVIIRAARLYREHLSGNVFLYAFGNQCIAVEFPDWSFEHLAGVNLTLPMPKGRGFTAALIKKRKHRLLRQLSLFF